MRTFGVEFFHSLGPCRTADFYGISPDWNGTLLDVIDSKEQSVLNRLWVIFLSGLVSERFMVQFVDWCQAQLDINYTKEAASMTKVHSAKTSTRGSKRQHLFWAVLYCHSKIGDSALETRMREMLIEGEKTGDVL